ncbi:shikimate dehydrogenase [Sporomusa malonica]|uniref:Shikimate dehydrogenase (NADP(+)) n=1 Tax=Sporomusa malonica TaxID=112901 RepID=A0A1W2EC38_9FIRM|nr:shikimate dehydrogenase [Sporomusa malonica]SMD06648.1 shikimate dehydrogenase [Sporomusa malonica]
MNITAKTQKVGLLGWPLSHSLSPAMHNAAFAASGLDFVYLPLPTPPEALAHAVAGLRALGFVGVNVTIPHKVTIMEYLDEIDISAKLVGAVNTLVIKENRLIGYNTDANGYISSLRLAGVDIEGKQAVILGAGGAARAIVAGFIGNDIAAVTIGARDKTKADGMARLFTGNTPVSGVAWDKSDFARALSQADIIVNTTPLGMYPNTASQPPVPWEQLKPAAVVSDLVYNPLNTEFMAEATRRGHKTIGGAGMLVEQGALAYSLWTGQDAPREIMQQTLIMGLK